MKFSVERRMADAVDWLKVHACDFTVNDDLNPIYIVNSK